jgi:hypothetical protein
MLVLVCLEEVPDMLKKAYYTPGDSLLVRVGTQRKAIAGLHISHDIKMTSVVDGGCGIPAAGR